MDSHVHISRKGTVKDECPPAQVTLFDGYTIKRVAMRRGDRIAEVRPGTTFEGYRSYCRGFLGNLKSSTSIMGL